MPRGRNRSLVIAVAVTASLALVVAVAAFRDILPGPLGFLGLGLFVFCLAMLVAIGWETRREMLAAREAAARGREAARVGRRPPPESLNFHVFLPLCRQPPHPE